MIHSTRGLRGMAVAPHALASQSALAVLREGGNAIEIADQAQKEGIKDLRQSALRKVKAGSIDLAQANACTMGE